jgi:hypothetical protein
LRTPLQPGNVQAMLRALAVCVLLCACGHDRAAIISAHIVTAEGSPQATAEGASGTLTCPNAALQDLGTVDLDGQLRAQHIGAISLACTVTVAFRGYQPLNVRIEDVCKARDGAACAAAQIEGTLTATKGNASKPAK